MPDAALQSEVLEDLTFAVNYRHWLIDLTLPWLGDETLEIGSGRGDYAGDMADRGMRVTASEADRTRLEHLRTRFADHDRVIVRELVAPVTEEATYDSVVAFNVLEHITDDTAALASFGRLVRPGGNVVVFVPAFPAAMSHFDRQIGHERRYRRDSLANTLVQAGLCVRTIHYVNSVGLIAWFIGMRVLGMQPRDGLMLRAYDRLVVPMLRRLEDRFHPPFGQSLLAVASTSP